MDTAIPSFVPVIGSSFDNLAQQQAGWAGFNANVQWQNLDSFQRATDARNNYFQTVAEMRRADQQRQQAEQAAADADAVRQYQFNVNAKLDANQQDIERQKIAAQTAAKNYLDQRKQAVADAKDNEVAADALAGEGHFDTAQELDAALPNSTPMVKAALWAKNQQARQQLSQQYDFAGNLAKKENEKKILGTEVAKGDAAIPQTAAESGYAWYNPAKYNPLRLLGIGALARAAGGATVAAPDTSWFDALQKRQTSLNTELAPVEKQGLDANGIVLDPQTGQWKPASTPSWLARQPKPLKQLDRATALQYLTKANGDKTVARQMASADGYSY